MPQVSVIIPTHNDESFIAQAIDSVLEQTYQDYEVIVVDDGSTDNTGNILKNYGDRIKYIYQEHQGVSKARNMGIEMAQSDLISFLDADDYFLPEHLKQQVNCLEQKPSLGLVSSGWRRVDEEGNLLSENQPWQVLPKLNLETWLISRPVMPSAMTIRKKWLNKVNGFKDKFTLAQDIDLILRLSLNGCLADWSRRITSCYRSGKNNATNNTIKQAKFFDEVFEDFFAQKELPQFVAQLENKARYSYLKWLGWRLYSSKHYSLMATYLSRSFSYANHSKTRIICDWINYFENCSLDTGVELNAYSLSNLHEWKNLITSLISSEQNTEWEAYIQQGDFYIGQGEVNTAIMSYKKALQINPNIPEATEKLYALLKKKIKTQISANMSVNDYRNLGETWKKQDNLQHDIVVLYSLAVEQISDDKKIYKSLGDAYKETGQLDEAIAAYQTSIKLDNKFPWSYKGLGDVWDLKNNPSKAIANYIKAIKLKSKIIFQVGERLETLLDNEGRWNESAELYRYVSKKYPSDTRFKVKIHDKLGDLYIAQQDWNKALENFVQALQIEPDYFAAYEKIAYIFELKGQPIVPVKGATTPSTYCELPQDFLRQYCKLTENYIVDSKSDFRINHIPVFPSEQIQFLSSKTLEDKEIPSCLEASSIDLCEAFVAVVPNGRCWGDKVTSAVIDTENKLIANTYTGASELVVSSKRLAPPKHIDGVVAFLSVRWGTIGYFHWIIDILTRIELLRLSGIDLAKIDKFVINRCKKKFQIETLGHIGIPKEKIVESYKVPHIQAKTLVVPSIPQLRAYRDAKWACKALRERFVNSEELANFGKLEYVYINRLNAPHRRVVNENQVISFLESWGFTSIALESMSFSEQVLCMASAKAIVAVHGAGLSNLVFCNPGTKVIEIFSPAHTQNTYWRIGNVCELDHYHLMSDDTDPNVDLSERSVKRDVSVNLKELTKLFKIAEIDPLPSYQKAHLLKMQNTVDTCVLYRILGNDLPPRHKQGQVLENLRFILDREPPLNNCQKHWVVNRIVDRNQEKAILKLLEERNQTYIHIPFVEEEYAKIDFNYRGFPCQDYFNSEEYRQLTPSQQERAVDHLYHSKNIYVMNNNGSRNTALREGRTLAKWVLPWDGNCFLTEKAWQEIFDGIKQYGDRKYLIVPMARILSNEQLLDPNFKPDAVEEPQIIFRQDAMEEFNERTVRYGHFSKLELLKRLGVPGKWDRWGYDPWDIRGRQTSCESGNFQHIGWVARLFSGEKEQEQDATQRQFNRLQAIKNFLDTCDTKYE